VIKLENWYKLDSFSDNGEVYMFGNVYDDKRFTDGTFIMTSAIVSVKRKKLITKRTEYKLGKPSSCM
jgi:hypothetical protein